MRITAALETGYVELFADPEVVGAWTLVVNGIAQSHVDLNDPAIIAFDYLRRMADIIDALAPKGALDVLHLGGGAMTLPRCMAVLRPGSRHQVVEFDADLIDLVLEHMPLNGDEQIDIVIGDALDELSVMPDAGQDVVVADIFRGGMIPRHVSTVEFAQEAKRVLRPGGLYIANIMDSPPLNFARRQAGILRDVFDQVAVVGDAAIVRGRRHGNLLLVGVGKGMPLSKLVRLLAADPHPVRVEHGARLAEFCQPQVAA